jgi:D-beta-D-heptose 7-phosphate kinase/D-beta-D-heptose 1-phosphate adenosyltransferase
MTEPTTLIPWLAGKRPVRVAVVGDVMLDEYLDGSVTRISPEAPVPVHLVTKTFHVPGGAANAALNVQLAGGEALLFSVTGDDDARRLLLAILGKDKVDCANMVPVSDRPTVRKTRITANSQHQLVRVDWERVHAITPETRAILVAGLRQATFDAVLLSDYGKGTLTPELLAEVIALAQDRKVPVIVDPKGRDYAKYRGATLITPNRKEACDALGLDAAGTETAEELGRQLQRTFGLENVLVTLGPKGMLLVPKAGEAVALPAIAREVFDVSGAGDTVVALMALGLAARTKLVDAMHVANTAAAVVVGKWGTQPIYAHELEAALRARPDPATQSLATHGKVTTKETLQRLIKDPATRTRRVVFTNGCFDLLHPGHVEYLEAARSKGDLLVVGVNTDASVRALKGPDRPLVALESRMRVLAGLAAVDFVVPFGEATPLELITFLVPDVLVKGGDYSPDAQPGQPDYVVGEDVVRRAGGTVETIPLVAGQSTSALVAKAKAR